MSENKLAFPTALRMARKEKGLSQTELAAQVGVSLMTIRRFETGESFPNSSVFGMIAIYLQNNSLLDAWIEKWIEINEKKGIPIQVVKNALAQEITEAGERATIIELARRASPRFIARYYTVTERLLELSEDGVDKAIDQLEMIKKITEYRKSSQWHYRNDKTYDGETEVDAKEEFDLKEESE